MKYLVCLFAIPLIISGCKKKPVNRVDPDLKAAFSYKPGTYWIYKDSLTGAIDSFVITTNDDNFSTNNDRTLETIGMNMAEYIVSSPYLDTSLWKYSIVSNQISLTWDQTSSVPHIDQVIQYNPFTYYPFTVGVLPNAIYSIGIATNVFSTYTVGSSTYSNVEELNDTLRKDAWSFYHYYNDWFYLTADVGIIKMRLYHPQDSINRIWQLQRWHIVK